MTEHIVKCNKFNKFFSIVYNLCCCKRRNENVFLTVGGAPVTRTQNGGL